MKPDNLLKKMKTMIANDLSIEKSITIFVENYLQTNINGCKKDDGGDMLLFQWGGPYSWNEHYCVNITRQFYFVNNDGDYKGTIQLGMTIQYHSDDMSVPSGNIWLKPKRKLLFFKSAPNENDVSSYLDTILKSDVIVAARPRDIAGIKWELEKI